MKIIQKLFFTLVFSVVILQNQSFAGVMNELPFVTNKANFMMYTNTENIFKFASEQKISKYDLPYIMGDQNYEKAEETLRKFGLTIYDIDEVLSTVNTDLVKSKKGSLILVQTKKDRLSIPEEFKNKEDKDGLFLLQKRDGLYITTKGSLIIVGHKDSITEFLKNKDSDNRISSSYKTDFLKQSSGKTYYMSLNVSEYLKKKMDNAVKNGARLGKGLDANVYIQSLMRMESLQIGLVTENGINFFAGVQGGKQADAQNLLMVSHFVIVGSSFALTFADMYSKRRYAGTGKKPVKEDKSMEVLQKIFPRIKTSIVNNGVKVALELNDKEIAAFSTRLKNKIEREKENRIARLERKVVDDFILAIGKDDKAKIAEFLNKNINLNGKGMWGSTILNAAAKKGNSELVSALIKKGADVNLRGRRGYTAIQNAVQAGKTETVKVLISKGASLTIKTWNRSTLLHMAVQQGNLELVKLLAEKGVDVKARDYRGKRPIDIASQMKAKEIVNYFTIKHKQSVK